MKELLPMTQAFSQTEVVEEQSFFSVGPQPAPVRVITTPGDVTVTNADGYIIIDNNSATNVNIDPSTLTVGILVTIKAGANANSFPITIVPASGTIDGDPTFTINVGYMSIGIINDGVELSIV